MATRPVTFRWFAAAALAAGVASSAAFAGNWELFGPSDARFVALGGTPKFDGLVFGYTIATTGGGKALQPYVSLDNGQRWRRTPPIDVDPSTRTYSTALGGGTTPILYLEAADRLFRSDDQGKPGVVFQHLFECLRSGRVFPQDEAKRSTILRAK